MTSKVALRASLLTRRSMLTLTGLLAVVLAIGAGPSASAAEPPQVNAVLLLRDSPFACEMVDEGEGANAWVYCWANGGARHVKLDPESRLSFAETAPIPTGLGGPGQPYGTWRTVGRFRCELQRGGVECVVIATGVGFRIRGSRVIEVRAQPGEAEPAPALGKSVVLRNVAGIVRIREPGTKYLLPLNELARLPLGTLVDTTRGSVQLSAATDSVGGVQTGLFHGGVFRIGQPVSRSRQAGDPEGLTVLTLVGRLPERCGGRRGRAKAGTSRINPAARRGRSGGRRLWGNAHGEFQTGGRYASATVSGTKWLTRDTCAGTLVAVARGAVRVEDRLHQRTVTVTAGHRYLAHPGGGPSPSAGGTSHALIWRALDGKVTCGMAIHPPREPSSELLCSSRSVPPPKHDSDTEGDPGFVFLKRTGSPRLARLSQYSFEVEAAPTRLAAGREWTNSRIGVTCTIGAATVRCANRSRHGFTIGASYDGF